jgi:hypothetical protein
VPRRPRTPRWSAPPSASPSARSVNFFVVRKGEVWAPSGKYQLHGITRANVLKLARDAGVTVQETDFSLTKVNSKTPSVPERPRHPPPLPPPPNAS